MYFKCSSMLFFIKVVVLYLYRLTKEIIMEYKVTLVMSNVSFEQLEQLGIVIDQLTLDGVKMEVMQSE